MPVTQELHASCPTGLCHFLCLGGQLPSSHPVVPQLQLASGILEYARLHNREAGASDAACATGPDHQPVLAYLLQETHLPAGTIMLGTPVDYLVL